MVWVRRAFWTSLVIYLVGVTVWMVLMARGPVTTDLLNARSIIDLFAGLAIILGLVMLGRWVWAKLYS